MVVDLRLPKLSAALCIESEHVRFAVAEVHGIARRTLSADRSDGYSVTNDRTIFKRPVHTTRRRIQRIDIPVIAADEYAPGSDGGLRVRRHAGWKAEGPLQFQ